MALLYSLGTLTTYVSPQTETKAQDFDVSHLLLLQAESIIIPSPVFPSIFPFLAVSLSPIVSSDLTMLHPATDKALFLKSMNTSTVKFLNFRTPENLPVINLKFKQRGQTLGCFVIKT